MTLKGKGTLLDVPDLTSLEGPIGVQLVRTGGPEEVCSSRTEPVPELLPVSSAYQQAPSVALPRSTPSGVWRHRQRNTSSHLHAVSISRPPASSGPSRVSGSSGAAPFFCFCVGPRRRRAAIEDRPVVLRVLIHFGLPTPLPELCPARTPSRRRRRPGLRLP